MTKSACLKPASTCFFMHTPHQLLLKETSLFLDIEFHGKTDSVTKLPSVYILTLITCSDHCVNYHLSYLDKKSCGLVHSFDVGYNSIECTEIS